MSDRDDRLRPAYGIALPPQPVPSSDITIALVVHVLGGVLAVVGLYHNLWVLAALVPAIVLLLASRRDHPWRREEARNALNFQVTCVAVTLLLQGLALLAAVLLVGNGQTALALSLFAAIAAMIEKTTTTIQIASEMRICTRPQRPSVTIDRMRPRMKLATCAAAIVIWKFSAVRECSFTNVLRSFSTR